MPLRAVAVSVRNKNPVSACTPIRIIINMNKIKTDSVRQMLRVLPTCCCWGICVCVCVRTRTHCESKRQSRQNNFSRAGLNCDNISLRVINHIWFIRARNAFGPGPTSSRNAGETLAGNESPRAHARVRRRRISRSAGSYPVERVQNNGTLISFDPSRHSKIALSARGTRDLVSAHLSHYRFPDTTSNQRK